jgi:hypothetical protein
MARKSKIDIDWEAINGKTLYDASMEVEVERIEWDEFMTRAILMGVHAGHALEKCVAAINGDQPFHVAPATCRATGAHVSELPILPSRGDGARTVRLGDR